MAGAKTFFPHIDYATHPAFRTIVAEQHFDDMEVDGQIARIDAALAELHGAQYPDEELPGAFGRGPGSDISALRNYLMRTSRNQRLSEWFNRAFADVEIELLEEAKIANWRDRNENSETDKQASGIAETLHNNGMYACNLEPETLTTLRGVCAPHMNRLREKGKEGGIERIVYNFERYSDVGVILERFFERQGILKGLKGYVGSHVEFAGFSLEYSHDKQKWWRGLYADIGLPDAKTAYMHYDHGSRDPKAIVALSDVSEETGPTGYVKGSHLADRSGFLHTMVKSLDHCFRSDPSLPYETTYYRNRFSKVEYRREFLEQPAAFRACSHFGDDILDDTPLSRELLSKEVKVTRNVGNCIVFDGNYGIHRGAMVRNGERFVFQIVFNIAPPLPLFDRLVRRGRGVALRMLGKGN